MPNSLLHPLERFFLCCGFKSVLFIVCFYSLHLLSPSPRSTYLQIPHNTYCGFPSLSRSMITLRSEKRSLGFVECVRKNTATQQRKNGETVFSLFAISRVLTPSPSLSILNQKPTVRTGIHQTPPSISITSVVVVVVASFYSYRLNERSKTRYMRSKSVLCMRIIISLTVS